jgi:hypothetical protein
MSINLSLEATRAINKFNAKSNATRQLHINSIYFHDYDVLRAFALTNGVNKRILTEILLAMLFEEKKGRREEYYLMRGFMDELRKKKLIRRISGSRVGEVGYAINPIKEDVAFKRGYKKGRSEAYVFLAKVRLEVDRHLRKMNRGAI